MDNNLCIIPARGGSKRIPRKNIRPFLGKPIIAYSIETAIKSGLFNEVMVSTDDTEIADVGRKYGASVPFLRSSKNADDFATTMDVVREVVVKYEEVGKSFDYICCIYPTAPLMQAEQLQQGLDQIMNQGFNKVFPVVPFSYPIWRGVELTAQNRAKMLFPEHVNARSQDLPQVYHDAGQWYWLKPEVLDEPIFNNAGIVVLNPMQVQDIDNEEDWEVAEQKYRTLYS